MGPRAGDICGSSPRGRGTPVRYEACHAHSRFIPARAGNTSPSDETTPAAPVHPRAGGEHTMGTPRFSGAAVHPRAGGEHSSSAASAVSRPVHPRAGGEHWLALRTTTAGYGSSPRGRGTPPRSPARPLQIRFIPARAGNTAARRLRKCPYQTPGSSPRGRGTRLTTRRATSAAVHPRAGGEHTQLPYDASCRCRPVHPRAGGEHCCGQVVSTFTAPGNTVPIHVNRFIPARAGNTPTSRPCSAGSSPRGRGTHNRRLLDTGTSGSSPRGRGTRAERCHVRENLRRFIPARAGNTGAMTAAASAGRRFIPARAGNTPIWSVAASAIHRFIPARAGNTRAPRCSSRSLVSGSSPRGRGTPRSRRTSATPATGSSPRGRGTLLRSGHLAGSLPASVHPRAGGEHMQSSDRQQIPSNRFIPARAGNTAAKPSADISGSPRGHSLRFIPARAGNTFSNQEVAGSSPPWLQASRWASVHPRAGGEHHLATLDEGGSPRFIPARAGNTRVATAPTGPTGSSPRGRGTHTATARICSAVRRFIPARAGNTRVTSGRPSAVHPRAGGEHTVPRAGGLRFIPARAGNTNAPGPWL